MGDFDNAIGTVATQVKIVEETTRGISQDLRMVSTLWSSPAAQTFEPLRTAYESSSDDLNDVLAGILHRMRITYDNYLETERKAIANLKAQGGGGGSAQDGGSQHDGSKHGTKKATLQSRREGETPTTGTTQASLPERPEQAASPDGTVTATLRLRGGLEEMSPQLGTLRETLGRVSR